MRWSLPLSSLRAFEAAARFGVFRLAAEELNLTPSAVSHAIRRLEKSLGTALFERDGRVMRLSQDGQTLMRHVSVAFEEMQRGIEIVSGRGPALLRLHCAPSFATLWLMPRLASFLAAAPGVTVRLAASATYADFSADGFDADIVYGRPERPGLVVMGLGEEELAPLCAPAVAARLHAPGDLAGAPLIDSDNKQYRWADWCRLNDLPPPAPSAMRFDRSFMALAAAADGLGVALESTRLAAVELASGRLVRALPGQTQSIHYVGHHLVFPRAVRHRPQLRRFGAWLGRTVGVDLDAAWPAVP